jgi:protein-S-isoprenylcysteine O-methyltransferase Ste14
MTKRFLTLAYGAVAYLIFFGTFLYLIGFVGNLAPRGIDSPAEGGLGVALLVDLGLVLVFGLQHSIMARPAFKRRWTRFVPEAAERSTYVIASCIALALLMWQWRPLGGSVWELTGTFARTVAWTLFVFGWGLVFVATFLINHFDLFGLRQSWLAFRGRPYSSMRFVQPWLYRRLRHPLYLGFLIAFWAAPVMTVTHLAFAAALTGYMLFAIRLEERDLMAEHAEYGAYRQRVPMLLPRLGRRGDGDLAASGSGA